MTPEKIVLIAALFIGTAFGLALGTAKADTIPDVVLKQTISNVYKIDWNEGYGTGTWITPNLILTNCHVAEEDRDVHKEAVNYDGSKTFIVKMVLCDKTHDLAIMESSRPNRSITPVTLADTPIQLGKDVFSAGYGVGSGFSLKAGIAGIPHDFLRRSVTLPTAGPGDSGSPIYNAQGELVGIMNSGMSRRGVAYLGKAFVIKLDMIRNYLRNLQSKVARSKGAGQ